jgi:hypothetical protein
MKPDLSRVTFIKEEKGGYSKKYRIKDAQVRVWVAKLGKEAQSETAAVRLVGSWLCHRNQLPRTSSHHRRQGYI